MQLVAPMPPPPMALRRETAESGPSTLSVTAFAAAGGAARVLESEARTQPLQVSTEGATPGPTDGADVGSEPRDHEEDRAAVGVPATQASKATGSMGVTVSTVHGPAVGVAN